jgi:hypothetical protein
MNETDILREHADLLQAIEERPLTDSIKVPDRVLVGFEEARQKALCNRKAPRHSSFVTRHSTFLRLAATFATLAAISWLLIPSQQPTARVVITSPGDVTTDTRPRIAWNSKDNPGQKYDVWIIPAEGDHLTASVLFVAKNVTSPVAFDQLQPGPESPAAFLQPGADYRVLVCLADAGRLAGVPVPFRVKRLSAP